MSSVPQGEFNLGPWKETVFRVITERNLDISFVTKTTILSSSEIVLSGRTRVYVKSFYSCVYVRLCLGWVVLDHDIKSGLEVRHFQGTTSFPKHERPLPQSLLKSLSLKTRPQTSYTFSLSVFPLHKIQDNILYRIYLI